MWGEGALYLVSLLFVASVVARQGALFLLALGLLTAMGAAWLWKRHCLTGVTYLRELSEQRAFFGEEITFTVEIANRKLLPLPWLQVEEEIPHGVRLTSGKVGPSHKPQRDVLSMLVSLRWYERVRRHYRVRCLTRGEHAFGPVVLRSGDIFGFTQVEQTLPRQDRLLVYPRIVPLHRLGLPAKDPLGDRRTRQWLFEDPLRTVGVREFTSGDSPRRIHWKASARTQTLQVKLFEPTTTYRLVIFLNLNTYGSHWWWQGYHPELLERAVTTAASVAKWAIDAGYQAGLCVNGQRWGTDEKLKVPPGRDPEQLTHMLETLARVLPFATMPLERLLQQERHDLPYGATLVVITALWNDEVLAELMTLKAAGHQVALLPIGGQLPAGEMAGITVRGISDDEGWIQEQDGHGSDGEGEGAGERARSGGVRWVRDGVDGLE